MLKKIGLMLVVTFCSVALPWAVKANDLPLLIESAIQNNPELEAARSQWKMFEQKIVPAASLDDPMLSLTLSNIPFSDPSFDATPISGKEIRISQKFPYPGKLDAKQEMAHEQAQWYQRVYEDSKLQLTQKVKDGWYRLYVLQRSVELTQANLGLLEDFTRLTENRYAVGQGMQQDILKAQVEHSRLLDRLIDLEQKQTEVIADLTLLTGVDSLSSASLPKMLTSAPAVPTVDQLFGEIDQNRPLITAYRSVIRKFEAQQRLARLEYKPDVTLFASYRQREEAMGDPVDGSDFFSLGFSVNLPIWQKKRQAQVAEAHWGGQMATGQLKVLTDKILFQLTERHAALARDRRQIELLRNGLIPQAQQAFEASLSAYQVGKVEFLSLLDSLLKLYNLEIDLHRRLSTSWRNLARLEATAGRTLSGQ